MLFRSMLGKEGLMETSNHAVLNANYVMESLRNLFTIPYARRCMHECVFSAAPQADKGVHAIDLAKFLIDQGIHPPTVYFPLTVKESIMVEPTETESRQTLDIFIEAMSQAANLIRTNPEDFQFFPKTMPISRPDEVKAAKDLDTNFFQSPAFGGGNLKFKI